MSELQLFNLLVLNWRVYTALWLMDYFLQQNHFTTGETILMSLDSVTIFMKDIQTRYMPYFHQFRLSHLTPEMLLFGTVYRKRLPGSVGSYPLLGQQLSVLHIIIPQKKRRTSRPGRQVALKIQLKILTSVQIDPQTYAWSVITFSVLGVGIDECCRINSILNVLLFQYFCVNIPNLFTKHNFQLVIFVAGYCRQDKWFTVIVRNAFNLFTTSWYMLYFIPVIKVDSQIGRKKNEA